MVKKAVIFDGSHSKDSFLSALVNQGEKVLESKGFSVEVLSLREMNIASCSGCFHCWLKTPGRCVIKDDGQSIPSAFINSDVAVFISQVMFGGYDWMLKRAFDRIIPVLLPFFKKVDGEIHHGLRYNNYPHFVSVGVLPFPDSNQEKIFVTLNQRNARNFSPPGHSVGVVYENKEVSDDFFYGLLNEAGVNQ